MHVIENASNPPRIADSADGLETQLPAGAELEWVRGMAAGEPPVSISAVRQAHENSYRLHFPLRPGETRLQIAYRLKVTGNTNIALRFPGAVARLAIVVPEGLHFIPANGLRLQRTNEQGAEVEMIAGVGPDNRSSSASVELLRRRAHLLLR